MLMGDICRNARSGLSSGEYDEVWCVVDHDERDQAIYRLRTDLARIRPRRALACVSTPCFEYWLLLHFEFTAQPFRSIEGGDSACTRVVRRLRKHIGNYRKNQPSVYLQCRERLDDALKNCKRGDPTVQNPATDVAELVERLRQLAKTD